MTTGSYGCYGVSNIQGPPSSLWHKPLPGGKTAVRLRPYMPPRTTRDHKYRNLSAAATATARNHQSGRNVLYLSLS